MKAWLAVLALAAVLSTATFAQDIGRREIARHDLSGTNTEVILSEVDVPPGGTFLRHTHHGEEAYFVLEGAEVQLPGKDPSALPTGSGGINVRDVPHSGFKNVSDHVLKLVTVHVVDKGKPLYEPSP